MQWVCFLILAGNVWILVYGQQCPQGIQYPCICSPSRYQPVTITCTNADSLETVLSSVGRIPTTTVIDSLVISNTNMENLPPLAFQRYYIKHLVLRNNGLKRISDRAFDEKLINTLLELEFRNNKLGEIPLLGVPKLRNLKTLILAGNGIQALLPRAFGTYQSKAVLQKLDLSGNFIRTVNSNAFLDLKSIRQISFDKNLLTSIPTAAMMPLKSLEDLSLGVNQITNVFSTSLQFPNLKSLSLEVNNISSISVEAFRNVPDLLYLYLSTNKFTQMNRTMFQYIPKLKVLAMGNNNIRLIPSNAFQYIPELVRLEMSDCKIENIEPGALQKVSKIQVILLNKNRISKITRNMFQGLSQLVSLDLKGNIISFIENGAWRALPALRHLDISKNKIETLRPGTFVGTFRRNQPPTTRVLYIYDNQWVCDGSLQWFRRWLRNNKDIMINAPGYRPTLCFKPRPLFGMPIRTPDPITPKPRTTTAPVTNINQPFQQGATSSSTAAVSLVAVVLGITLGVFLLSVLLLMVVRYFISKNRRERKEEDEEARRLGLGSTTTGYNSHIGSAYPSPAPPGPGSFHGPQRGYFLNRPWYWWF